MLWGETNLNEKRTLTQKRAAIFSLFKNVLRPIVNFRRLNTFLNANYHFAFLLRQFPVGAMKQCAAQWLQKSALPFFALRLHDCIIGL